MICVVTLATEGRTNVHLVCITVALYYIRAYSGCSLCIATEVHPVCPQLSMLPHTQTFQPSIPCLQYSNTAVSDKCCGGYDTSNTTLCVWTTELHLL